MKKSIFLRSTPLVLAIVIGFSACGDPNAPKSREEQIEEMVNHIRETPDWIGGLKAEAEKNHESIDSVVMKAAIFMVNKNRPREERIAEVVATINKTPEWRTGLQKQAELQKRPLDSIIMEAAGWTVDESDGKHAAPAQAPAPAQTPAQPAGH